MSSIDEAKFAGAVRFTDGAIAAVAAAARYVLDEGLLELSGSEPRASVPHVVNEQISIDAAAIDVTLAGPKMKATGNVKSVLQPAKKTGQNAADSKTDTKMPSMLKQDQPTNVTANDLDYDGAASKATYTGAAQLWQADTTVRAGTLVIDDKTGDLTASGKVATSVVLEQAKNDQPKASRTRRNASARWVRRTSSRTTRRRAARRIQERRT